MKNRNRLITCFSVALAALMFNAAAVAGGNGSGNEPPKNKRKGSASSICNAVPLACIFISASNGSGNEPPKTER